MTEPEQGWDALLELIRWELHILDLCDRQEGWSCESEDRRMFLRDAQRAAMICLVRSERQVVAHD